MRDALEIRSKTMEETMNLPQEPVEVVDIQFRPVYKSGQRGKRDNDAQQYNQNPPKDTFAGTFCFRHKNVSNRFFDYAFILSYSCLRCKPFSSRQKTYAQSQKRISEVAASWNEIYLSVEIGRNLMKNDSLRRASRFLLRKTT